MGEEDEMYVVYTSMPNMLRPLELLRNVEKLEFDFSKHEMPAGMEEYDEIDFTRVPDPSLFDEKAMKLLVQGSTPVDAVFEMYPALLEYAQSFETFKGYRDAMAGDGQYFLTKHEKVRGFIEKAKHWNKGKLHSRFNPFTFAESNTVENRLDTLRKELDANNVPSFKEIREEIIQGFEPQYHRITRLMDDLVLFVKEHKRYLEILSTSPRGDISG